ncbi:serine-rich adhesin for platelets isoform X11 [Penaeus vannamei]|uniref:serine-rich adhesin for platelets isoform X11 n=1 Tax=Penaeus vannamei TaxID=6689 RepID=UPI00387F5611
MVVSMLQCAPYIKNLCQTIHTWKNEDIAPLSSNGVGSSKTSPTAEEKKKEAAATEGEEGASGEERKGSDAASEGHASQTSSWLPPLENWDAGGQALPYGWEAATDKEGKPYFINHLNKTTTYEDPRKDYQDEPPQPRQIDLIRDPEMGFGFVAGSEKPVIVRFVTEGGPSVEKLLPGDQILMINGEDVKKAPRDHVIQLVRSCKDRVQLTVTQPPLDNSERKSALLSAAKKQRLKNNPSRVRFAESVDINGSPSYSPSNFNSSESTTPFMPNVLKVFLENGQTKSFKYDSSTTVGDVLDSLHQKLGIKCPEHFSLVVEHVKSLRRNKLTILDPKETLSRIAARPGAQHLRCLYRVTFVPRDAYDLLRKDSMAFEYLYLQCCNDVIQERFAPELQFDVALRLAALHIQQHALTNNMAAKVSVKTIEKDCGLERFVPSSYVDSMKRKELRKILSHFLKLNSNLTAPGQKQLTALQAKLHYLKIISELPSYGAKCFSTNMKDTNMETVILISPRFGISQITGIRNSMPEALCEIEQVTSARVSREDELSCRVELSLKDPDKENLVVSLEDRDAEELVLVLQGYYRLLTENPLAVTHIRDRNSVDQAPPYHSRHKVQATNWSYATTNEEDDSRGTERYVDLSVPPPYKPPPEGYKVPNGHLPGLDMDETGVYVNSRRQNILDSNMNKTNSVYENANDSSSGASPTPQSHAYSSHHAHPAPASPARQPPADTKKGQKLLPNNEVVESEERSGSDTDSQSTPTQSPAHRPAKPPQRPSSVLKPSGSSFGLHSPDNLPLTLQNREDDIKALIKQLEDNSGLPYTFAEGTLYLDPDIIDLTMIPPPITPDEVRPQAYDGAKVFPPQLSTPPTPFADRETLEKELKALEQDLGDLRSLTNPSWLDHDANASYADSTTTAGASDTEDSMSLSSLNTSLVSNDSVFSRAGGVNGGGGGQVLGRSPNFTLAALRQLGIHLEEGEDIDSFIANLTIPPPPEGSVDLQTYAESRKIGSECDFSAFIIPPPPSSDNKDNRSSDIIRRLYEAKEGISRMVGDEGSHSDAEGGEKDLEIGEVRVSSETMAKRAIVGKVASLQRRFEVPPKAAGHASPPNSSASIDNRQLLLKLSKDKSSSPSDSSGYDSLRSNNSNVAYELDAKLAQALEENDKMFKSFDTLKRKQMANSAASAVSPQDSGSESSSEKPPSVMSRVRTFNTGSPWGTSSLQRPSTLQRQMTVPAGKAEAKDDDPPPPPPRTPVTRTGTLTSPKKSAPSPPSKIQRSISMSTGNLVKSASQGDIMSQSGSSTIHKSPTKSTKSSASSEDLSQAKTSPGSPSKQSVASSNDSLTSSSSIVTVKSASLKSLETDEDPPELPPRNGTKTAMKPPLPRSSSQDNVKVALHNKGIRSPSPVRKTLRSPSPDNNERPPSVPSRLRKPQLSPSSSPTNSIPGTHRPSTSGKLAAPSPPTLSKAPAVSPTSPRGGSSSPLKSSPKTSRKSPAVEEQKPLLPAKTSQSPARRAPASPPATNGVRSPARSTGKTSTTSRLPRPDTTSVALKNSMNQEMAPLQTSSPKMSPKAKMVNGKTPNTTDLDDSLDSGSFDQDSLEEAEDVEMMPPASRDAFRRLSLLVSSSLKSLTEMAAACTEAQRSGGTATQDETKFQEARDALTSESRQFVTASKLFVKSATESEDTLLQCLSNCMTLLQRMVDVTRQVVHHTTTPLQTQNVVVKVRDVATTYQSTVRAALSAAGRGMDHPSMNTLMTQATNLAGVLTALMRTLRVFSP